MPTAAPLAANAPERRCAGLRNEWSKLRGAGIYLGRPHWLKFCPSRRGIYRAEIGRGESQPSNGREDREHRGRHDIAIASNTKARPRHGLARNLHDGKRRRIRALAQRTLLVVINAQRQPQRSHRRRDRTVARPTQTTALAEQRQIEPDALLRARLEEMMAVIHERLALLEVRRVEQRPKLARR